MTERRSHSTKMLSTPVPARPSSDQKSEEKRVLTKGVFIWSHSSYETQEVCDQARASSVRIRRAAVGTANDWNDEVS